MTKELIDLSQVGMIYEAASGPVEALAGISLEVGMGEFVFVAHHFRRQRAFVILIVHRQVVDTHEFCVEFTGAELGQCMS